MNITKTSKNKMAEPAEVLAHARQLYHALALLVRKIDNEGKSGTPLIPLGKLGAKWDDNYPAELSRARQLVETLRRRYEESPALWRDDFRDSGERDVDQLVLE